MLNKEIVTQNAQAHNLHEWLKITENIIFFKKPTLL